MSRADVGAKPETKLSQSSLPETKLSQSSFSSSNYNLPNIRQPRKVDFKPTQGKT